MSRSSVQITFSVPPDKEAQKDGDGARLKFDADGTTKCPAGGTGIIQSLQAYAQKKDAQNIVTSVLKTRLLSQRASRISISHGKIGKTTEAMRRCNETFFTGPDDWVIRAGELRLDLAGRIDWDPSAVHDAHWAGIVLDAAGNAIQPPEINISGTILISKKAVYGQIVIAYDAIVTETEIEISPRLGASELPYQSSLLITGTSGSSLFPVPLPLCFGGASITSPPEEVSGADPFLSWNFCGDHKMLSDSVGIYRDISKSGPVCYPGVPCNPQPGSGCLPAGETEE